MPNQFVEPNDIASRSTGFGIIPVQLWAGEAPKHTDTFPPAPGVSFEKYEVFSVNSAGQAIKFDPTAAPETADGANKPVGFTAQAFPVGAMGVAGYTSGAPNHEVLKWPESLDTYAKRRVAFLGTPMFIGELNRKPVV